MSGVPIVRARTRGATSQTLRAVNARLVEAMAWLPPLQLDSMALTVDLVHLIAVRVGHGVELHRHVYFELSFLIGARVCYRDAHGAIALDAGACWCLPPLIPHRWTAEEEGTIFGFMIDVSPQAAATRLARAAQAARYCLSLAPPLVDLQQLVQRHLRQDTARPELLGPLLAALILGTFRQLTRTPSPSVSAGGGGRLERALAFLAANCSTGITVEDVAAHVALSPRQLNRLLHERENRSVKAAITAARIEKACRLLHEGHSVKEAARLCGYGDCSYFCRAFARQVGQSPNRYRQG